MTRRVTCLLSLALASGLLAGCTGSDEGTAPPPSKPLTQEQIKDLPPIAQQGATQAQAASDAQARQMQQMAAARRKAAGGG